MAEQPSARTRALVIISTTAVALVLLLSSAVQATGSGAAPELTEYRVRSGDTLWDIAVDHGPTGRDPREIVHHIQEMNDLDGAVIQPGQVLEIPIETER